MPFPHCRSLRLVRVAITATPLLLLVPLALAAEVRVFVAPTDTEAAIGLLRGLGAEIVFENRKMGPTDLSGNDLLVRIDEAFYGILRTSPLIDAFEPDYLNCIAFLNGCDDEPVLVEIFVEPSQLAIFRAYVDEVGGKFVGYEYLIPPHALRAVEDRDEVSSLSLPWRPQLEFPPTEPRPLHLGDGHRFSAHARYRLEPNDPFSPAAPLELAKDTGAFSFFEAGNLELVVKVLPACEINGHIWVFVSGLTDLEVELKVADGLRALDPDTPQGGEVITYINPPGTPFAPILDTTAMPCL